MADLDAGVGVEAITGGVLVRSRGAGEGGAFRLSTSRAPPSGLLIGIAAFRRDGLEKAVDAESAFGVGVWA